MPRLITLCGLSRVTAFARDTHGRVIFGADGTPFSHQTFGADAESGRIADTSFGAGGWQRAISVGVMPTVALN